MTDQSDGRGGDNAAGEDPIGTAAEEAAKLLGAMADWAREASDHIATDDAECRYCPVCRTVHAVRQASPEVREHLASAAAGFLQAAAGLLASAALPDQRHHTMADPVQHIDLDEDLDEGLDEDQDEP